MKNNHKINTQPNNADKGEQITMAFMEENLYTMAEKEDKVISYPEKTPKKRGRKSKAELELLATQQVQTSARHVLDVQEIENLANEIKTEFNITPDNPPKSTKDKKRGRKKGSKKAKQETQKVRHVIKKSVIDRVKEFVQICPKVPSQFVYYVGYPNDKEREIYGLDKNLTFAKILIWDGEANFAFTIGEIEVFEVENIIPNESKIVKGEQEWVLHQYREKPGFLDIAESQLKYLNKNAEVKNSLSEMKDIHNKIFHNHTVLYETLVGYQNMLNNAMAENIETYNRQKQDFQECQVAIEKVKYFLTTLKN